MQTAKHPIGNDFVRRLYLQRQGTSVAIAGTTKSIATTPQTLDLSLCQNMSVALKKDFCSKTITTPWRIDNNTIVLELPKEQQSEGLYRYQVDFDLPNSELNDKLQRYSARGEFVEIIRDGQLPLTQYEEITAVVSSVSKGEQGLRGERGEKGKQGERGERGLQGEKGEQGERGERGLQGEKGEQGERGERGLQGEKGEQGERGERGLDGADGEVVLLNDNWIKKEYLEEKEFWRFKWYFSDFDASIVREDFRRSRGFTLEENGDGTFINSGPNKYTALLKYTFDDRSINGSFLIWEFPYISKLNLSAFVVKNNVVLASTLAQDGGVLSLKLPKDYDTIILVASLLRSGGVAFSTPYICSHKKGRNKKFGKWSERPQKTDEIPPKAGDTYYCVDIDRGIRGLLCVWNGYKWVDAFGKPVTDRYLRDYRIKHPIE